MKMLEAKQSWSSIIAATGQPYYFSEGGTGPSESGRARTERQAAFERGEGEL
jgi:hypothetical protein